MTEFDFSGRKLALEDEKADRQAEAQRILEARKQASIDLREAFTSYLKSTGRTPQIDVTGDTHFTIIVGRLAINVTIEDYQTFKFRSELFGNQTTTAHKSGRNLNSEEVTDALLRVIHPELEKPN